MSATYLIRRRRAHGFGISIPVAAETALGLIFGGQSLAAARGGTIVQAGGGSTTMAVGGAHTSAFAITNSTHAPNADDWASAAVFAEGGAGQSPLAGCSNEISGYDDVLLHSAAIGAQTLEVLHGTAFAQMAAAVQRTAELLIAAGNAQDAVKLAFAIKHGEANANTGTSQADYEELLTNYITHQRLMAKWALNDAAYVAPVHLSFPVKQNQPDADRTIKKAILAVADTLPSIYIGEVYSIPVQTDRVHPTPDGYVLMGERAAHQLENEQTALRCTSFTGSGTSWTATFNKDITRDASFDWGSNLDADGLDGLEVYDQTAAALIDITNLTYNTNSISITLASAPTGTAELRIACQDTASTLVGESGPAGDIHNPDHTGCFVRSTEAGWASTFDPTYTHYDRCIPQIVEES